MKRLLIALACLSFTPVLVSAEELCPGCNGGGYVGCPACAEPFGKIWVGKCKGCQGPFAQSHGRCTRCNGTGVCQSCRGKGQACMVCKGSGRVPDGTNESIRAGREREAKAKLIAALKPLEYTIGAWKGEGVEGEKKVRSEYSWERLYGDRYRALISRRTVDGETTESAGILTFNPGQDAYQFYTFYSEEGSSSYMTGRAGKDGRSIVFTAPATDGREVRLTWGLDPDAGRTSTLGEIGSGEEWETFFKLQAERTGDSSLTLSSAEPAGKLKALAGLIGTWDADSKADGKNIKSKFTYTSVLGGHWFLLSETGGTDDAIGMLTWSAESKAWLYALFMASGNVTIFTGEGEGDGKLVFTPTNGQKIRWTWELDSDNGTMRTVVEGETENGWKVFGESDARRK